MGVARKKLFRTPVVVAWGMTVTGLLAETLSAGESGGQPLTATAAQAPDSPAPPPPIQPPTAPDAPPSASSLPSLPVAPEPPEGSTSPDHSPSPETTELELPPLPGPPDPTLPRGQAGRDTRAIGPPPQAGAQGDPSEALRRIRRALKGRANEPPTGDPILDDLLEHLSWRKSVLEGSSLDAPPPASTSATAGRAGHRAGSRTRSRAARAAEQLLKAARILESLGPSDAGHAELVARMRNEAVQLLSPRVQSESLSAGE